MNEPIQYREYKITQYGQSRFWYAHDEYTGDDNRCGWASSEDEAKSDIDNNTIEEQEHQIAILRKKVEELNHLLELERKAVKNSPPF